MADKLNLWTVFHKTKDFGDKYVVRRFEMERATEDHFSDDSLDTVRDWIRKSALSFNQVEPYRMDRQTGDDPVIVEVWV